jgi:hypothetical protein
LAAVDLTVLTSLFRGVAKLPTPPPFEDDEFSAAKVRGAGSTSSAPLVGTEIGSGKLGALPSLVSADESPIVDDDLLR